MSFRLSKIDELSLRDHYHLTNSDECWYFGEYTAYRDWSFSDTNQLIKNFKKDIAVKGTPQWRYKIQAINEVGNLIASEIGSSDLSGIVMVPVPPSKIITDPAYDPRVFQALNHASQQLEGRLVISECVTQINNTEPDHLTHATRLTPEERALTYNFHIDRLPDNLSKIIIVDDVLTTGSHYKGMELAIRKRMPDVDILGLFVARRVCENEFENIDLSALLSRTT